MVDQIDLEFSHSLSVTWDVGRRCNLDCTYCPSYRHDLTSPFASLEELKTTGQFVFDYFKLMMPFRTQKAAKVDFTGGEPTINPHFSKFSTWLRNEHKEKYANDFSLEICLTSNGIINEKMRENLETFFDYATFSYHCEATGAQKERFFNNMMALKQKNFPMKVNVMFHARSDYFEECLEVCSRLKEMEVSFVPRLVGEKDNKDRYNHQYSKRQLEWMKLYWKDPDNTKYTLPENVVEKDEEKSACSIGRPCCGKRKMSVCRTGQNSWEPKAFIENNRFKDWYCSVNWFFLHIEQQTEKIYHHQTCQATFDYGRGAVASTKEPHKFIEHVKSMLDQKKFPIIKCSKEICGCGLCAPKAKNREDLLAILPKHVNPEIFEVQDL